MRQKAAKYLGTKEICLVFFMKHIQLGFLPFLFGIHLACLGLLSVESSWRNQLIFLAPKQRLIGHSSVSLSTALSFLNKVLSAKEPVFQPVESHLFI